MHRELRRIRHTACQIQALATGSYLESRIRSFCSVSCLCTSCCTFSFSLFSSSTYSPFLWLDWSFVLFTKICHKRNDFFPPFRFLLHSSDLSLLFSDNILGMIILTMEPDSLITCLSQPASEENDQQLHALADVRCSWVYILVLYKTGFDA